MSALASAGWQYARYIPLVLLMGGCAEADFTPDDAPPPAEAQVANSPVVPPQEGVRFTTVEVVGRGCPRPVPEISADRSRFTLAFTNFAVTLLPGQTQADMTCQIIVGLTVPPGYRFAVSRYNYFLLARLSEGMRGELLTSYSFAGSVSESSRVPKTIGSTGGTQAGLSFTDEVSAPNHSQCGVERALNIRATLSLTNVAGSPDGEGLLKLHYVNGLSGSSLASANDVGAVKVSLVWEKCS